MSLNKSYVKSLALVAVAALVSAGLVGLQAAPASSGERAIPRLYWAEPQMISSDLSMVTLGVLPDPTYGAKTATSDGFIVKISNYDPNYSWTSTATNNGVATISNTGWVTVVGLNPNTISTATITSTLAEMGGVGIVRIGRSEVTGTSLGAALAATFGTVTPTSDGFIFSIANYDASFSWAGSATNGGSVAISNTGLVTVTRVVPNTSSTITVVSSKPKYVSGSATITATALRSVLTPTFSPDVTPTPDGFIFIISNVDASFIWAGTATNGGSVAISNTGLVTVTGVAPNTSSTVTVTSTKTGFDSGLARITASSLRSALTASFGNATPTPDGFSFIISNVDASFSWAGTATNGGSVAISNTGLVTVTGVAPNTSSTVTVTSTKTGFAMGRATIIATALQPGGAASFGTVNPTSDGFIFSIANYDASFSWAGSATNGGSVAISNTGLVTVTGLALNTSSTVTITSFKAGLAARTATITASALQPGGAASFGTVNPTSDGFIFSIANYDASFSWAGSATNGGSVAISNTGLVTVTGLALNTSSTVTITSFKAGLAARTATITATAAQGIEKRLTVGTFKGYVAIYQKGYQGQTMTAKVAGKWMKVDSIASDFERTVRYTGAGYRIFIHLYIDGALVKIIQTITE